MRPPVNLQGQILDLYSLRLIRLATATVEMAQQSCRVGSVGSAATSMPLRIGFTLPSSKRQSYPASTGDTGPRSRRLQTGPGCAAMVGSACSMSSASQGSTMLSRSVARKIARSPVVARGLSHDPLTRGVGTKVACVRM